MKHNQLSLISPTVYFNLSKSLQGLSKSVLKKVLALKIPATYKLKIKINKSIKIELVKLWETLFTRKKRDKKKSPNYTFAFKGENVSKTISLIFNFLWVLLNINTSVSILNMIEDSVKRLWKTKILKCICSLVHWGFRLLMMSNANFTLCSHSNWLLASILQCDGKLCIW